MSLFILAFFLFLGRIAFLFIILYLIIIIFMALRLVGLLKARNGYPDFFQNSAEDVEFNFVWNDVCKETAHVLKVKVALSNLTVQNTKIKGI